MAKKDKLALVDDKYVIGKCSVVGDSRRKYEDRVFVGEIKRVFGEKSLLVGIVADGVGSAGKGTRGAQLAIDKVVDELKNSRGSDIPDIIERAIIVANQAVYQDNEQNEEKGQTTLVVAVVYEGRCFVANVGDSRAYWAQSNGALVQLTRDHTYYGIYGGAPDGPNADHVVNYIGQQKVQVDLGLYLQPDMTKEQSYQLGYAGLPLEPGDSILLCSDGLIKTDRQKNRYATDEEIVNALHTEVETDRAALKMVGVAEGRRPTDNVSAVTIQYLSDEMLKTHQLHSVRTARRQALSRIGMVFGSFLALIMISVGAYWISRPPVTVTVVSYQTLTPMPSLTPTQPIAPDEARVEQVFGKGGNMTEGEYLTPTAPILSSDDGVKIVVGETGNKVGVMFWFADSVGKVDFDADHMKPVLESGALFIQPGRNKAEVYFLIGPEIASVEGSRMIVQLVGNDIWVYCFEGKCRLDPGGSADELKIEVGYKRVYRTYLSRPEDAIAMTNDEMWDWDRKCHSCLFGVIPPTPTATPTQIKGVDVTPSPVKATDRPEKTKKPAVPTPSPTVNVTPTPTPKKGSPSKTPTEPPPTTPPTTPPTVPPTTPPTTPPTVPPTDPPPTNPPPTDPPTVPPTTSPATATPKRTPRP